MYKRGITTNIWSPLNSEKAMALNEFGRNNCGCLLDVATNDFKSSIASIWMATVNAFNLQLVENERKFEIELKYQRQQI